MSSAAVTLLVAFGIIRWQAPQLLGLPHDLHLVQLNRSVPPFYEGIFRQEDLLAKEFILKDPLTRVRAKPLYAVTKIGGPHDLLGFRNRSIANIVDVVVIGDSQTYGNNAVLEENWPNQMQKFLKDRQSKTYAMAVGGWCAVQYLDMFNKAILFQPKLVVVAFYSGNDPLESFHMVYGNKHWSDLIPDSILTAADAPRVSTPVPESEMWAVSFNDGVKTIFSPNLRLASNMDHPAVQAGYGIMLNVAERIANLSRQVNIDVIFTIIPTKELVYSKKVQSEGLDPPQVYATLVERESENIKWFARHIGKLSNVVYVDVVEPMQLAALMSDNLYLQDINGHPDASGYRVIGKSIANRSKTFLSEYGLYGVQENGKNYRIVLINEQGGWFFSSMDLVKENGWPEGNIPILSASDFSRLTIKGIIREVDKVRFGPVI